MTPLVILPLSHCPVQSAHSNTALLRSDSQGCRAPGSPSLREDISLLQAGKEARGCLRYWPKRPHKLLHVPQAEVWAATVPT